MIKCLVDHRSFFSFSRSSFSSVHSISFPFLGRGCCGSITVCHVIPGYWGTVLLRWVLPNRTFYARKGRAHGHITRRGDRYRCKFFSGRRIDIPGHCFVNPGHCGITFRCWIINAGHLGIHWWWRGVTGWNTGSLARLRVMNPAKTTIMQWWGDNLECCL